MSEQTNERDTFELKSLPEKLEFIKGHVFESYKVLEEINIKGHDNIKHINMVFDALYKSTIMLDISLEEAMNLEVGEKKQKEMKDEIEQENDSQEIKDG